MKKAFITGITGQDGSYLTELLLKKNYEVHGLVRRASTLNLSNLKNCLGNNKLTLHYGDLTDGSSLDHLVQNLKPDEIYNLAAQSHVRVSFDNPVYTGDVIALGTIRLLEAVRHYSPKSRFYQASTSELFGNSPAPQKESTPMEPVSPYSIAKYYAHRIAQIYRESYSLFISCGILFNHESPRREPTIVTRKICRSVARIHLGLDDKLFLGNLEARRDWGYAPEYVEGMWKILQLDEPVNLILGTGETHSVKELVTLAFSHLHLNWKNHVIYDKTLLRPSEVNELRADCSLAKKLIGWKPKVTLEKLVSLMVNHELKELQ